MIQSRRDFLKNSGALIVSFSASALAPQWMGAQGPFDTQRLILIPTSLIHG
jgi:hypothetical protein